MSASYGENGSHISGYGTSYSYDIMGNVLSLSREGDLSPFSKGTVDDLSMAYDGNRLLSVSDSAGNPSVTGTMDFRDGVSAGVEYSYDRNGAMTSDLNRGVTGISYNRAGRPARISYAGGVETFSYMADGTKLARTVSRDGEPPYVTEYRGNLVYEDGSLKYVLVDGGMVSMEGSAPRYLYFLDDHLGSTRVVAAEDGTVAQVNHYYPFGMSYASRTMSSDLVPRPGSGVIDGPVIGRGHEIGEENDSLEAASFTTGQPYRFIGNELYADNGLGLYDFHARMYDLVLGRFLSVDPLAETYYSVSPYAYCAGNPVIYVDAYGLTTYNVGNRSVVLDDGFFDTVDVTNFQLKRLVSHLGKRRYNDIRRIIMNKNGYIDANGVPSLKASWCVPDEETYSEWFHAESGSIARSLSITGSSTMIDSYGKSYFDEEKGLWKGRDGKYRSMSINGNQYTGGKLKYAKKMSVRISRFGKAVPLLGTLGTTNGFFNSLKSDIHPETVSSGADLLMNLISYTSPYCMAASVVWSIYGKYLFDNYLSAPLARQFYSYEED